MRGRRRKDGGLNPDGGNEYMTKGRRAQNIRSAQTEMWNKHSECIEQLYGSGSSLLPPRAHAPLANHERDLLAGDKEDLCAVRLGQQTALHELLDHARHHLRGRGSEGAAARGEWSIGVGGE